MNKYKKLFLFTTVLLSAFLLARTVYADDLHRVNLSRVLMVEKPLMTTSDIHFPNDERLYPKSSDFKIVSYVLLSSELGDREAVLTVENTSSGQRFFEHEHIMAIFADGRRKFPNAFREKFTGKERLTIKVTFALNTYPILSIYTAEK